VYNEPNEGMIKMSKKVNIYVISTLGFGYVSMAPETMDAVNRRKLQTALGSDYVVKTIAIKGENVTFDPEALNIVPARLKSGYKDVDTTTVMFDDYDLYAETGRNVLASKIKDYFATVQ